MKRRQPAEKLPPARVGSFAYDISAGTFSWSAEVAAMHGYPPEPMTVEAGLVLAHKHRDDRRRAFEVYQDVLDSGSAVACRYRIVDRGGAVHSVMVISKNRLDEGGTPVGMDGFYVDLSEVLEREANDAIDSVTEQAVEEAVDVAVAEFTAHRAVIEQAKGMVMMAYRVPADRAFDVLKWRSQQSNVKIHTLCELIVTRAVEELALSDANQAKLDDILLSAPARRG